MTDDLSRVKASNADDILPPVEPPSAGFIVQLFVVPGVIVIVIVAVWLLFHWLAAMGNNPTTYIEALKRNNDVRWQAAVNLANALSATGNEELKRDSKAAEQLSSLLEDQVKQGAMDDKSLLLREYLARALGAFEVPAALPGLLVAATTQRDPKEQEVQRDALAAIATLNMSIYEQTKKDIADPRALEVVLETSRDKEDIVRSSAAYALGMFHDDRADKRLISLLDDLYPDARYNAAIGLARRGNTKAVDVLIEMLNPQAGLKIELDKSEWREQKRQTIVANALRAIARLKDANPDADLARVVPELEKLQKEDIPEIRSEAEVLIRKLQRQQAEKSK